MKENSSIEESFQQEIDTIAIEQYSPEQHLTTECTIENVVEKDDKKEQLFEFNPEIVELTVVEARAQEIFKQRMEQGNEFRKGNVKWQGNVYETVDDMIKAQGLQPGTIEAGEFMKNWDYETAELEIKERFT